LKPYKKSKKRLLVENNKKRKLFLVRSEKSYMREKNQARLRQTYHNSRETKGNNILLKQNSTICFPFVAFFLTMLPLFIFSQYVSCYFFLILIYKVGVEDSLREIFKPIQLSYRVFFCCVRSFL